jgi:hypothetical protein
MHQSVEVDPNRTDALSMLVVLGEKTGSICLRKYAPGTLICDTKLWKREDRTPDKVHYRKVELPTWVVSVKKGRILGIGRTPEEAISRAFDVLMNGEEGKV